jgi:hypothetical protein
MIACLPWIPGVQYHSIIFTVNASLLLAAFAVPVQSNPSNKCHFLRISTRTYMSAQLTDPETPHVNRYRCWLDLTVASYSCRCCESVFTDQDENSEMLDENPTLNSKGDN